MKGASLFCPNKPEKALRLVALEEAALQLARLECNFL
jgi:hypothetical protein